MTINPVILTERSDGKNLPERSDNRVWGAIALHGGFEETDVEGETVFVFQKVAAEIAVAGGVRS